MSAGLHNPRANWPFSPAEDMTVAQRRFRGDSAKAIASDLGRSPVSVHSRFRELRKKLRRAHGDVLQAHRQQELDLLRKLIAESRAPEVLGDEW